MVNRLDQERLARERRFHDRLAEELRPESMPPRALSRLDAAVLERAGELRGRRVLDLGCGSGDFTLALATCGARVVAVDISPGMVDVARRRLERFVPDAEAEFLVAPAEDLPLEDSSIDLIVGRFILHHLELEPAAEECARVLSPAGRALFAENSGRNRLLMFARDKLAGRFGIARYGTPDEHPLSANDLAKISSPFSTVGLDYPVFDFFTLFDRQVLRHRWPRVTRFLRRIDAAVWRWLPAARPLSFRVVIEAHGDAAAAAGRS